MPLDFGSGAIGRFLRARLRFFCALVSDFLRARHRRRSTTKSGGYNTAGYGRLRARAFLPGRLLPDLPAGSGVFPESPVVFSALFFSPGCVDILPHKALMYNEILVCLESKPKEVKGGICWQLDSQPAARRWA